MENINLYIVNNWKSKSDSELSVELNISENAVRKRRNSLGLFRENKNGSKYAKNSLTGVKRLQKLLVSSNIDVDSIDEIKSVKTSNWNGFYKDKNGDAQTVDLKAIAVTVTPKRDDLSWPVIQVAAPVCVTVNIPGSNERKPYSKIKTCVVLPDIHIGYRLFDGQFEPFHSEKNLNIALEIIHKVKPDIIVVNGDFLDLPSVSRHEQEPSFALTMQKSLDEGHKWLALIRSVSTYSRLVYTQGNHEKRLGQYILNNAAAAFGIKRANEIPESWPVFSVPSLLHFDKLKIEYIDGWPNGEFYLNDRIKIIHGEKLKASQVAEDSTVSVCQGHSHRVAVEAKTRKTRTGYSTNYSYMIGCLSRTDGALPSTKSSLDVFGRPTKAIEAWQAGLAYIEYLDSGKFNVEQILIEDGVALWRGNLYEGYYTA
jgi:hypothetical protein